jgi:hypothetical protein
MPPNVKQSLYSDGLLTVRGKAFLGAVALEYPPLKVVFSGAVALGEPPPKIHFRGCCSKHRPCKYIFSGGCCTATVLETIFSRTAVAMQASLKMYLQVQFTEPPLKISFELLEFEISRHI